MKFFFLFFISISALATEPRPCHKFVNEVLKPAVTEKENDEKHPYRFIRDEKDARAYIDAYDVKLLGIENDISQASRELTECKYLNKQAYLQTYCNSLFENYHFLKGLVYGMKNYGWSEPTIKAGTDKIYESLKTMSQPRTSLIYLAVSYSVLNYLVSEIPQQGIAIDVVRNQNRQLEKVIDKVQQETKRINNPTCLQTQKSMKEERIKAHKFAQSLSRLINQKVNR